MAWERAQPQILIVATEPTIRELLDAILQSEGYGTQVAVSPAQALALYRAQPVDLVLTDLFPQPEHDPLLCVQSLQRQVAPSPVGVVTGWSVPTEHVERAGFAFLVRAPFELDYLLLCVASSLRAPLTPDQHCQAEVVEHYFAALSSGSWDVLLALCTDDVTYVLPAPSPFATTLQGKAAFRTYTQETFRNFPAARFTTVQAYASPQGIVARYVCSWQTPEGQVLEQKGAVIFTFAGALIAQIGSLVDADRLKAALIGASRLARA